MPETILHTPVVQVMDETAVSKQVQLFLKREDLIHPFISGNKWRKLKYIVEEVKQLGKHTLVSFGGAYSNHLVALACAGAMHNLHTHAFVRGEEVTNPMLFLCRLWGMKLTFVSREAYRNKEVLFQQSYGNRDDAYFVDEGGRGLLGAKGCGEILDEVSGFTHVICAVGTGTTLAGLARAAKEKKMVAEGICVLKGAEEIGESVSELAGYPVTIHHGYHRGGYAKTDAELMQFIQRFATETGTLLDQVYTAKMMMGVLDLIRTGYFPEGSRLLLIHTGGLLGLLSQATPSAG